MDISGFISQILTVLINPVFEIIYWLISLVPKFQTSLLQFIRISKLFSISYFQVTVWVL